MLKFKVTRNGSREHLDKLDDESDRKSILSKDSDLGSLSTSDVTDCTKSLRSDQSSICSSGFQDKKCDSLEDSTYMVESSHSSSSGIASDDHHHENGDVAGEQFFHRLQCKHQRILAKQGMQRHHSSDSQSSGSSFGRMLKTRLPVRRITRCDAEYTTALPSGSSHDVSHDSSSGIESGDSHNTAKYNAVPSKHSNVQHVRATGHPSVQHKPPCIHNRDLSWSSQTCSDSDIMHGGSIFSSSDTDNNASNTAISNISRAKTPILHTNVESGITETDRNRVKGRQVKCKKHVTFQSPALVNNNVIKNHSNSGDDKRTSNTTGGGGNDILYYDDDGIEYISGSSDSQYYTKQTGQKPLQTTTNMSASDLLYKKTMSSKPSKHYSQEHLQQQQRMSSPNTTYPPFTVHSQSVRTQDTTTVDKPQQQNLQPNHPHTTPSQQVTNTKVIGHTVKKSTKDINHVTIKNNGTEKENGKINGKHSITTKTNSQTTMNNSKLNGNVSTPVANSHVVNRNSGSFVPSSDDDGHELRGIYNAQSGNKVGKNSSNSLTTSSSSTISSDQSVSDCSSDLNSAEGFSSYLDLLPDDVIVRIFSNLSSDQVCRCSAVCRRWYALSWDATLWKTIQINSATINIDRALKHLTRRLSYDTPGVCIMVEKINLSGCEQLTDKGLFTIAKRCAELRHLEIQNCAQVSNIAMFELVSRCVNLEHLNVTGCEMITCISLTPQATVQAQTYGKQVDLRYLDMSDCFNLEDSGLQIIASYCTQLVYLYLRRCSKITDIGVQYVANYCHNVKELSVSDCRKVTDSGMKELSKLGCNLRYLSVAKCDLISDAGVTHLARHCPRLRYLNVRGCERVSDIGIQALSRYCPRLRSLDIGKCDVTDEGLQSLANHSPHLRKLSLKSCDAVTDTGLMYTAEKCPQMQQLNIQECNITVNAYRRVKLLCKKCIIEHTNPGFY